TQVCLRKKENCRKYIIEDVPAVTHLVTAYVKKKRYLTQVCLQRKVKGQNVPWDNSFGNRLCQEKESFDSSMSRDEKDIPNLHSNGFGMASPESHQVMKKKAKAHQPSRKKKNSSTSSGRNSRLVKHHLFRKNV
ncbi:hypothetical protein CEXT_127241, partial [Caerostris extrusa]